MPLWCFALLLRPVDLPILVAFIVTLLEKRLTGLEDRLGLTNSTYLKNSLSWYSSADYWIGSWVRSVASTAQSIHLLSGSSAVIRFLKYPSLSRSGITTCTWLQHHRTMQLAAIPKVHYDYESSWIYRFFCILYNYFPWLKVSIILIMYFFHFYQKCRLLY